MYDKCGISKNNDQIDRMILNVFSLHFKFVTVV